MLNNINKSNRFNTLDVIENIVNIVIIMQLRNAVDLHINVFLQTIGVICLDHHLKLFSL